MDEDEDPLKELMVEDDFVFDDATKKQIKEIRRDFAHINHKAKKALDKIGVQGKDIKVYMSDFRNFTPSEWETLEKARLDSQHLKKDLFKALRYKPKKKVKKTLTERELARQEEFREAKRRQLRKKQQSKRTQDVKTKRRRKKMHGFKKGWVQMD